MQEPQIAEPSDAERQRPRKRRSKSAVLSWILFAAAGIILVVIGVIYYQDRQDDDDQAPVPTAVAGGNQVQNVFAVLDDAGLDVSYDITPHTARADDLSEVGQGLTVDDAPLYIFIYPDTAVREAESIELDPATFDLASSSGTPVSTEEVRLFSGSNVIAALYGGSDEVAEKVEVAIESLP